jgi:anti-sigma regulatory factor (Ser/Thr protein kinase)
MCSVSHGGSLRGEPQRDVWDLLDTRAREQQLREEMRHYVCVASGDGCGAALNGTAELMLDAELSAVPVARHFVTATLDDDGLASDAELVTAELVANAVLHGEAPIVLRVLRTDEGVRVEVEDCGRTMPIRLAPGADATTGRGLALVANLSARWGVDPGQGCKVVWAELVAGAPETSDADGDFDVDALLAAWADDDAEQTYEITLGAVPTALLRDAKEHVDSVVRELTLSAGSRPGATLPAETVALVDAVTVAFAQARDEIKRQTFASMTRGDLVTELVLHLPASAADAGERYLAALDEADRWARAARLLTLAPPRSHQVFRRWYVQALVDQLRAVSVGKPRPPVQPFPQVLAAEVDRLAETQEAWDRLQLLQKVTAELADAETPAAVAASVLTNAARFLGADSGRVYTVTDHGTLASLAVHGGDEQAEQYLELPLDAELPGPYAVRTGETLLLRNLDQLRERFPAMADYSHGERTLHVAPLRVGARTLGVFALTWTGNRNVEEKAQVEFVTALASTLAQALDRVL